MHVAGVLSRSLCPLSSQLLSFSRCYKDGNWLDAPWSLSESRSGEGFLCQGPEHVAAGRFMLTSCLTDCL